jgi:DNA-binding MarR family transcriptional regulator
MTAGGRYTDKTASTPKPGIPLSDRVLVAIRRIIQAIDLHSRYLAKHFGLTGPQLMILREVAAGGDQSVGDVARAVSLSQATVTGICERLEKRALITRMRAETDRRRVLVTITETGSDFLRQAPPPMQESFIEQFDRLKDWEQMMILSSLQRLVELTNAKKIDAAPILSTGPILGQKDIAWPAETPAGGSHRPPNHFKRS